jgi:Ala-tRNA(Pro) deacylase
MSAVNLWLEYLTNNDVRFSHSTHARSRTAFETADAERMPAREFAKTVVYFCETGFGIAVVPADQFVDLVRLAHMLGVSSLRLANEAELGLLFPDCELGAMPPFGDACVLPVTVDPAIAGGPFITFTMGTHRDSVRMSFADFSRLARPRVATITLREAVLV